jgi:asparagine synthase (glutamine-hydrolysing)
MCGIAGATGLGADQGRLVSRMTADLAHRGPDDEGVWDDAGVTLGHRRLSIFDLSDAGHQPMLGGNAVVTYNGEIYNWKALRRELESRGARFSTRTDTEVLLAMYDRYGIGMLDQFEGMFAFALWDRQAQVLHLVRDRYGVKPLFYYTDGHRFAFASELRCLRHVGDLGGVNTDALAFYTSTGYIPAPHTMWNKVHRLPPGHRLEVRPGQSVSEPIRWFDPVAVVDARSMLAPDQRMEALRAALTTAVDLRLEADVPVGVFLSGGIDSGIVAAMAAATGRRVTTLTVGFSDVPSYDESAKAAATARMLGTDHRQIMLTSADAEAAVQEILDRVDEPFSDDSLVPTYLVSKAARREVTVALSGDGGDELFGGYRKYFAARWAQVPGVAAAGPLVQRLTSGLRGDRTSPIHNYGRKARRFAAGATGPIGQRHRALVGLLDPDIAHTIARQPHDADPLRERLDAELAHSSHWSDEIARMLMADIEYVLPYDMLEKVDRASMWNSLEVRSPFLDRAVLPLAFSFGGREHVGFGTNKKVLREMASGLLPPDVVKGRKWGFGVPLGTWMRSSLAPVVNDLLDPTAVRASGLLNDEVVSRVVSEHLSRERDRSWEIWNALVLQAWARSYL